MNAKNSRNEPREKKCKKPNVYHSFVESLDPKFEICRHCGFIKKKS